MIRKLLVVLMCLTALSANARQVITGSLTDKETQKPVENASVELVLLPDSSTVELANSSSEGLFILYKADTTRTYCLRVKHLVYKTLVMPLAKKKSSINNVGTITLEPNTFNLKEIVVNGSKVTVTELGDRTVYGIPDGFKKSSSDGLDVLRKVPAVQVDYLNEDITVNGKTNIRIEVDGVTRDKGYLKRLHPTQISKMEIITSPSGKYDADVDAVINVITNPAMRYGLKGSAYAGYFPFSTRSQMGMMNGSLDYGFEKISYYISANGILQDIGINSTMKRVAGTTNINQHSDIGMKVGMGNVNVGLIYDPDELNDINLNIAYNNMSNRSEVDAWNYNLTNNIRSIFRNQNNSNNKNDGLNTSLFYKHKFKKDTQHGMEAELKYYNSLNNNTTNNFRNVYYNPLDTSEVSSGPWLEELTNTRVRTLSGQTNYTLPFDSVYFFNTGISGNYNHYRTDNTSPLTQAADMDYRDLRLGGYAELSRNFRKGSVKAGSRFETSRITINSAESGNYFSPLPYANATWKLNDNHNFKVAYSRRVIRPSSAQLNPFVSVVDSQTISRGNINLKPAYRDNFQFTYNLKLGIKKVTLNISPQLFYEYKTGLIQNIISRNSQTGVFENVPTNISNGYETGSALSVNSQIGKVLFNSNFRYMFYHIDKYLDQINATNRQSWNWNSFVMFPLPHDFQFMSVFNFSGPVLDGQTETKSSPFYMLGGGKQFKGNHTVRLFFFNPFLGKFFDSKSTIRNNTVYQQSDYYLKSNLSFMLMYAYSFKLGKTIEKEKHNVEQQLQDNIIKMPISL